MKRGHEPALAFDLGLRSWFRSPCNSCGRLEAWLGLSFYTESTIATIFFLHKASAATIFGTAAAVIAGVLYGLMTGSLTYLLVLLFWQPQQLVFVDRVCISQTDPGLQAEGLLSLGAYAGAVGSFVGTALVVCLRVGRLWDIVKM
ncbi:hypothetical protein AK812_SmicGene40641 [Symbiodinium microadriaticum]|uniref:Uncharacterized protein n=1 Tax=Symbiodinium microadriaticum TaxID=2951 RepID=A0A1Q9C870_SYMMI|nr:hypothetical protein AK812_SmicGene40641 [Symbiodinium microadriaticum]